MASRVMPGLRERGSHDSPPIPNESRREPQRVPDDCPPPRGLSAAIVAWEDLAGRPGPGSSAAALGSGGTRTSPPRPAHPRRTPSAAAGCFLHVLWEFFSLSSLSI